MMGYTEIREIFKEQFKHLYGEGELVSTDLHCPGIWHYEWKTRNNLLYQGFCVWEQQFSQPFLAVACQNEPSFMGGKKFYIFSDRLILQGYCPELAASVWQHGYTFEQTGTTEPFSEYLADIQLRIQSLQPGL